MACCIPGHDLENQVQFENLISGLGPGCKNPMMYPAIRYFYCLGCDPDQPKYTYPKGDVQVVRICRDFVDDALWHDETKKQYEECGVMKFNQCPEMMSDFDPYTCGDDLVIPTIEYADATAFMNYLNPPGERGAQLGLYKIFVHFNAFVDEPTIISLPLLPVMPTLLQ